MNIPNLHYYHPSWIQQTQEVLRTEICVYGGTAAGAIAAVKAARLGKSVVLLQPGQHLGGLTTGGLGCTDIGKAHVIGGMARQFYRDLGQEYGKPEEWYFEPHIAARAINRLVDGLPVRCCQYLDKVELSGRHITAISLLGGLRVEARMFIDASYEGDLLAKAGVTYIVGRESNAVYGETLNGIQLREYHQFSHPVDPSINGQLLPGIEGEDLAHRQGEGDHRIQAYCFRVCMTDDPPRQVPWSKPADFDPQHYVLATRWFVGPKDELNDNLPGWTPGDPDVPKKFDYLSVQLPGGYHKTDTNNHGPVSSDFIGANYDWPEAGYARREEIFQRHVSYQMGFYWHMANAPEIPERYRRAYARWGLANDEFADTGHWPHQLYVREARRMVSAYVLTEADCRLQRRAEDSVGMGSYHMDSHNCCRFVSGGCVVNEGDVQVAPAGPYPISYRSIVPRQGECDNLLVPVCLSASHIAYGSVRMEPVFMVLGESSAVAAALALDANTAVQDIDIARLRHRLQADGQVLVTPPS